MKKLTLILLLFIFSLSASSQVVTNDSIYNLSDVDKKPEFKDGINNLYKFVAENFRTPDVRKFNGKVYIEFVVEKDGSLTNIKINKDAGHGSGDEAVRVFKLSPNWKPGEKDGRTIRTKYTFPISIKTD